MKREDFFEVLSDIDENMIAAAGEREQPVKPVIVTVPKKNKKPFFAAAACIALAAAVTAAAVNVNRLQSTPDNPIEPVSPIAESHEYKTVVNVVSPNQSRCPDTLYTPGYDYSSTEMYSEMAMKYISEFWPELYPNPPKYEGLGYDELAENSQLIVMGTFIDDSRQVTAPSDIPDLNDIMQWYFSNKYISYNTLKVEKVLKSNGKVWEGDEIAITQAYVIVDEENCCYSFSQLTPMIKGDKWIYFLNKNPDYPDDVYGKFSYSAVQDYEGRYPVPDEKNPPFKYIENTNGVVAPAVFNQGIYGELKEKLENAEQPQRPPYEVKYEKVIDFVPALGYTSYIPEELNVEFEMEEFEGITFGWKNGEMYTRSNGSEERNALLEGLTRYGYSLCLYLCDLTGDGKREICFDVSFGSGISRGFAWIYDYANDKLYAPYHIEETDYGYTNYYLRKKDGELYLISESYLSWIDHDPSEVKEELLTPDMLTEIDIDQEQNQETEQPQEPEHKNVIKIMDLTDGYSSYLTDMSLVFDMEEFPDVTFERKPDISGDIVFATEHGASRNLFCGDNINAIYLCDLNGDGYREICLTYASDSAIETVVTHSRIIVIDYAENKVYTMRDYDYNFGLGITDDKIMVSKFDFETGEWVEDKPLDIWSMDIFGGGDN